MKQITVKDERGNKYDLCYTAKTVAMMEKRGFNINEYDSKPMTTVRELFGGAFLANHESTSQEQIDKIYEGLKDKKALLEKLVELYTEPFNGLLEEGNAEWEANW